MGVSPYSFGLSKSILPIEIPPWIIEDLGIIKVHTFGKGYRVTLQFEFKALSDSDKGLSAVACLF